MKLQSIWIKQEFEKWGQLLENFLNIYLIDMNKDYCHSINWNKEKNQLPVSAIALQPVEQTVVEPTVTL